MELFAIVRNCRERGLMALSQVHDVLGGESTGSTARLIDHEDQTRRRSTQQVLIHVHVEWVRRPAMCEGATQV